MKKRIKNCTSLIPALLAVCIVLGSCNGKVPESDENSDTVVTTEAAQTSAVTEGESAENETESVEPEQEPDTEGKTEILLEGEYAKSIITANALANRVNAFYNADRTKYMVVNQNMVLEYPLSADGDLWVGSIKSSSGGTYIENTMDVFVKTSAGNTYYASDSSSPARSNVYRLGYYYYDVHLLDQNFTGGAAITAEQVFSEKSVSGKHSVTDFSIKDGVISYVPNDRNPYVYTTNNITNRKYCFPAEDYNAVQFSMRVTESTSGNLYIVAGGNSGHTSDQKVGFSLQADGNWHTYTVVISGVPNYKGMVTALRFDVGQIGETVELKDIKAVKVASDVPDILLDRTLHTYSDKMNQVLHFVAQSPTDGIEAFGMVTKIPADRVNGLIVKDANGIWEDLARVDWSSAEYVGFDINGAGIFGYILLTHENSGVLEVSLEGGNYVITQTSAPEGGRLLPPDGTATFTGNDFYMGQRIYTDESHNFETFIREAECERSPMTTISHTNTLGYDALRGAYYYKMEPVNVNDAFHKAWNLHQEAIVSFEGGETDRQVYVYTSSDNAVGCTILDENDLMLPIPVMINKNFGHENEEPIFDAGDRSYGETVVPLVVTAGENTTVKILHLGQNWGAFPQKQLSSIQYFWPYYHLSAGVTETSCISPWYGARDLWTLPDFRSMSMPYWYELEGDDYKNQPQHTHGGYQYFLQYTDAEGNFVATENVSNQIGSAGPVYADVTMNYLSDDGRLKVSYRQLEFAQTDELRAYYEISYEVLDEIRISDFKTDFSFYSFEGYAGYYRQMGYLDENNQIAHKKTNGADTAEIIRLGDNCPYVSLYDLYSAETRWSKNNVNLGFVIYDSSFTVGGKNCDENFVVVGENYRYSLSLDLGEVTLKAGDVMKINMIITPWGFYDSADDGNMQAIRENTCLDPLTLKVSDGEAVASTFLPALRTVNGESAEFTFSGAENNVPVRIYGFRKLTAPKIYERVGGEWVEYTVSSQNSPDKQNRMHYYDGYGVYYDGDGTYSYAFNVNMDGESERRFKIVACEDFTSWPEETEVVTKPLNVYLDPLDLSNASRTQKGIGEFRLSDDEGYISIYGDGSSGEGYFYAFTRTEETPTGNYLVIKYRIPEDHPVSASFQIYASTEGKSAAKGAGFYIRSMIQDGEWHVLVADISKQGLQTFTPNDSGEYLANYLRFDVIEGVLPSERCIDIAYVGISDSLENICSLCENEGAPAYYELGVQKGVIDTERGEIRYD